MYVIPIFAILVVLPASKVTSIGGFIDVITTRSTASTAARRMCS
jgi:hypothetical protein